MLAIRGGAGAKTLSFQAASRDLASLRRGETVSTFRAESEVAETVARPQGVRRARGALSRRRDSTVRRFLALADCTAIMLALAVSVVATGADGGQLSLGALMLPVWVVLFKLYGLYDRDAKRVSHSTVDDIPWIFHGLLIGTILLYALVRASL